LVAVDDTDARASMSEGVSLLAVSAGFATAESLARVALAASETGHPLDGVVMVNADPSDSTAGVVPLEAQLRQAVPHTLRRANAERGLGLSR
jgi:hypothetical protein